MINSANDYPISQILAIDSNIKYFIPKYQREYIWGKENWEELINDIEDLGGDHFIGSIICINKSKDALGQTTLEIVDGQQRLTTISLLFCAIYQLTNQKIKELASDDKIDEIKNELINLKYRLIQKQNKSETKIVLSEQNNNFIDYKSILAEIGILEYAEQLKYRNVRIIYKAYKYYLNRLEEYSLEELINLLTIINKIMVVKIEVNSNSDAFIIFESLNNRGIPLTAIDLIKNKILSEFDKKGMSIDIAFDKWKVILQNLEDYSVQERFLRHYYNVFKYDKRVKIDSIPKALRSNLIKIYEHLIEKNLEHIFEELFSKSSIYGSITNNNSIEKEEIFINLSKDLEDLNQIKAAPSHMLLLYLFSLKQMKDSGFYKQIIDFLIKYFVRRNLTDFPNTRNLDQIFIDLIEELALDESNISFEFISNFLKEKDRISSDEFFKERLNDDIYEINIDVTRFILSYIEKKLSFNKEKFIDFWQRDKHGKLIWTIEHILPEGKNLPEKWINMIANGNSADAKRIQNAYVHKIGNLTLTGYNPYLSNYDFDKKKNRVDSSGKFIGYKNGLFLNEDLKDKNFWNEEDIANRTKKLSNIAFEIFNINKI